MPIYTPQPLKGLNQLPKEEQDQFIKEQISNGKLPKAWKYSQADRLYKNSQYRNKYGEEEYKRITDKTSPDYIPAAERDEIFNAREYGKAISEKYANDPNLEEYINMTPEGLKDLWESGIMSPEELQAREEEINSMRKTSEENAWKPKSKLISAIASTALEGSATSPDGFIRPSKETGVKDVAEFTANSRGILRGKEAERVQRKIDNIGKSIESQKEGVVQSGLSDDEVDQRIKSLYASNAKQVENLRIREGNRVANLPSVQNESIARADLFYQKVNNNEASLEDINKTFAEVFDNDVREDGAGSRYYTGYKDKKEFADFGVDDKVKALSMFQVLSEAYGDPAKAMQVIDAQMFDHAKNNQSFFRRRKNTLIGVGAKANAMLMNETFGGYVDLAHAFTDSPEEYEKFKTAEDVLTSGGLGYLVNPNYWNYVDQYGTWNPYEIARINQNSGIGGNTNLYSPTGKMTGEQFIDEGFKMLGYMLPAVVISAATKNVPRGTLGAAAITGAEVFGSAAALGSAYSSGTYNEIKLEAQQALDKMFYDESKDFVNNYYAQHPDYIQNYFKAKGVTQDDSDILTIPIRLAAENALYNEAKEAYFAEDESRRTRYEEAQKQILKDAQLGAAVDNALETARMAISGAFWGKWTKSKLTRDMLKGKFNPVKVIDKTAEQVVKSGSRARAAGLTVLNGGVDNWLDDITAGVGKGLGLGDYNNYLGSIYSPKNFVEGSKYAATVLDGLYWGMEGADEALHNPQSWIDGALGAAGSILGTRVNGVTLVRDAIKGDALFSRKGTEANKMWKGQSGWEKLNRYITNGVTTSIADSDERIRRTQDYIEDINGKIIPSIEKDITTLGNFVNETFDFTDITDDILAKKDIKQIGMVKSAVRMLQAYEDPVLSQIPEVQKFADMINRGRKGKFTDAELETFLSDPDNLSIKNSVDGKGNNIGKQIAAESMQHNINNFLKIADRYSKVDRGLSRNPKFMNMPAEVKAQIAVQLTLKDTWKERLEDMQEEIGTPGTERAPWSYEAEFGTEEARNRIINSLEILIDKSNKSLEVLNDTLKKAESDRDKASSDEERSEAESNYAAIQYQIESIKNSIEENKQLLKEKKEARVEFDDKGNARTLSKEEIMRLSPKQRAQMLSMRNRLNFSNEQRRVLNELAEELKNYISEDGSSTEDRLQTVLDAGTMQERLESSEMSIRKVVQNPDMLLNYFDRLNARKGAFLVDAMLAQIEQDQFQKLSEVSTPEEALEVVYRGDKKTNTVDKGFYIPSETVNKYIKQHPEAKGILQEASDMVQTRDDLYSVVDQEFPAAEAKVLKEAFARATKPANTKAELMASLEDVIDQQTDVEAKRQFDLVLERMKELGHQRDATKLRNRELEKQRKQEEEAKLAEEEASKDGNNFDWDGYKVGDTVYNKESGTPATVVGFEKGENSSKMLLEVRYGDGKRGIFRYDSITGKDKLSKAPLDESSLQDVDITDDAAAVQKSTDKTLAPEGAVPMVEVEEVSESRNPLNPAVQQTGTEEVQLTEDGQIDSPTAEEQAKATNTTAIKVPKVDNTDQGNVIDSTPAGVISGNRWVEYSVEGLKKGEVRKEVPNDPMSTFGRIVSRLESSKTKLQEIIDEEFGRMITDNPDIPIHFMMMKPDSPTDALRKIVFNVVELTPQMREKYHTKDRNGEDRGGVIEANGKTWLVVGTVGFASNATEAQRKEYDNMWVPISKRGNSYFAQNPNSQYYVDQVASSKVQNTTSGRIVNQREGAESPVLKTVGELLSNSGMTLRDASFGIQTNDASGKSFVTTKNVKEGTKVFPPRNIEDNRGRAFILIDTANGNKIPGMIEPSMYNDLREGSPLRDLIDEKIAGLFSTTYAIRERALRELRGYLVFNKDKSISIGNKDSNVLTIYDKQRGLNITQGLGKDFDIVKFFRDLNNANFQVNVTIDALEDPVILDIYDKSGALMTTVDSMRTAGMSYTIYTTDANGKPNIFVPAGNAVPGTGKSELKTYNSVRVGNVTFTKRDGVFINRNTGKEVPRNSDLWISCVYNEAIRDGHWVPIMTKEGLEYFSAPNPDGATSVFTRDGLGNIKFLENAEAKAILDNIANTIEERQRENNLLDVDLGSEPQEIVDNTLTQDQINQQFVGNFEAPAVEVKPTPVAEVVAEAKEQQSQQPKEVISDAGNKSLLELQKTEKLSTFASVATDFTYVESLYDLLEQKGWGITGNFAQDEVILKAHGVPTTGISNVEDWLNLIRDCK